MARKGMGLRPEIGDPRRMRYRMGDHVRAVLAGLALPEYRTLRHGDVLDQGEDGTCVGHAWVAWHNCKPTGFRHQQDHEKALQWYDAATLRDPWPDNDHDREAGTSTQAGVEVGIEWGLGESYVWAESVEAISAFIRAGSGAVVMGTYWYESMFDPDPDGFVTVDFSSGIAGGHEWVITGVQEYGYKCQNSWGEGWANEGMFYLRPEDLEKLIYRGGEACAIVQTGVLPG